MAETMKAVHLFEHGGPEVLQYVDVDVPEVGADEVLIKVRMTSINSWDLRYRAGLLPGRSLPGYSGSPVWPLPFQLGRDAAGEIVAVGEGVKRWRVGDRVVQMAATACGHCPMCLRGKDNLCTATAYPGHTLFGGYAEYLVRNQNAILAIPDHVGYEDAAALLWSYMTPMNCLKNRGPVGPGDTLMVTGASGGMSMACLQLGKLAGAKVIGTTTKPERIPRLLEIGWDHVFDSHDREMPEKVKEVSGGLGADAVWDVVGGPEMLSLSERCVRVGGTVVIFGAPFAQEGSSKLQMSTYSFIGKEMSIVGVRSCGRLGQQRCMQLLAEKKIQPVIDRVFPLAEASEAHAYLESEQQIGKVLLEPAQ